MRFTAPLLARTADHARAADLRHALRPHEQVRRVVRGDLVPYTDHAAQPTGITPVLPIGRYTLVLTDQRLLVLHTPWGRLHARVLAAPDRADVVRARIERAGLACLLYVHLRFPASPAALVFALGEPAERAGGDLLAEELRTTARLVLLQRGGRRRAAASRPARGGRRGPAVRR